MVELRGLHTKPGFNIAQALAPGQLRECEAQILIEARKPLDPALAVVARHATTKRCQRQVLHKLGKDIMALMHGDTLAAVGPHRCAAFPFTIEIETAPKSLFFPKFQHVSVGPTSNVGTAVSRYVNKAASRPYASHSVAARRRPSGRHSRKVGISRKDNAFAPALRGASQYYFVGVA